MAKKDKTPMKPPKPTAKAKIIVDEKDGKQEGQEADREGGSTEKITTKIKDQGKSSPPGVWDTYLHGKWKCTGCDFECRHFGPPLTKHTSKTKHNFSLVDVETGEVKAQTVSEARKMGLMGKPPKPPKKKPPITQVGVGAPPPADQQKTGGNQGPPPQQEDEAPPSLELIAHVARFMKFNPKLTQWLEQNPGVPPPEDLLNKEPVGSPQVKSSIIVKYVQSTAEVSAALDVLYDLIVSHPKSIEAGYAPTRGEWMEDTILEHYTEHSDRYGLREFLKSYMEGNNGRR